MVTFSIPEPDLSEVLRLACSSNVSSEEKAAFRKRIGELLPEIEYTVTERVLPKSAVKDTELWGLLGEADALVAFTAELGSGAARAAAETDPEEEDFIRTRAIFAERLNALTEAFCDWKAEQFRAGGAYITPHFPFEYEQDGPTVTHQIFGISKDPAAHTPERCRSCFAQNCPSRRE